MGNKSAEHPDGVLTQEVLKSFFGITENSDGSFSGGAGYERIPDNWYKRAIGDEYTIPFFVLDLNYEALQYPQFADVGGNTGEPNTFTGVNVTDLTSGVFNAQTLLEGNNLFCFAYQMAQAGLTDQLLALGGTLTELIGTISPAAASAISDLGCPVSRWNANQSWATDSNGSLQQLNNIETSLLEQFPGYTRGGSIF